MSYTRTAQVNDFLNVLNNWHERFVHDEVFEFLPKLNAVRDVGATHSATDLTALLIANSQYEVLGTNMTSALSTDDDGGGVLFTTAGAASDSAILLPHLNTNQSCLTRTKFNTLDQIAYGVKIYTGASVADKGIWAGFKLTNTPVVATDADQAFFRWSTDHASFPTTFVATYSVGGTDYEIDTGVTVVAATHYVLEVVLDADRVPRFFIDGKLVATGTAMTTDTDLIPYTGVITRVASAKTMSIRRQVISKLHNI